MIADGSGVVDGGNTSGEETSAGAMRALESGVEQGCGKTKPDACDLTGAGEICTTDVGMWARGMLSLQLSESKSMTMRQDKDAVAAVVMVWIGRESQVDERDGDDAMIVASMTAVIDEVVTVMKSGVGLCGFKVALIVGVGIVLFPHSVACHCGVAVVGTDDELASEAL